MSLKILTVDDSKTIRMIVKKAFKPFDCKMSEAENGVEGLAIAAREKPDLIVLDITMPVMNGIEMLQRLKDEPLLKDIPVIMLTAESGKQNVMQIVQMGVKDYIVKPFKGEHLIERTRGLVNLVPRSDDDGSGEGKSDTLFHVKEDVHCLRIPEKVTRPLIVEIEGPLQARLKDMSSVGLRRFVLDLSRVRGVSVLVIKLIILVLGKCREKGVAVRVVGTKEIGAELKEFQETSSIPISCSFAEAKEQF